MVPILIVMKLVWLGLTSERSSDQCEHLINIKVCIADRDPLLNLLPDGVGDRLSPGAEVIQADRRHFN